MAVKKNECRYCFSHGLYQSYWSLGYRRPMEAGASGKPKFPNEKIVPCDRCGLPAVK